MHRIVIPPGASAAGRVTITEAAAVHHLADVLRLRVGEAVECFDGRGRRAIGRVSRIDKRSVIVEMTERWTDEAPATCVTLALAALKSSRFDWAVQKATELGVDRIIPLLTARTVVRPASGLASAKSSRWQRIAQEASRQCQRATIPIVDPITPFAEALQRLGDGVMVIPTLAVAGRPLAAIQPALSGAAHVALLIGPEGDFTPEEVALAVARGAMPVSLGRLTLRSETAALVALTLVQHLLGEGRWVLGRGALTGMPIGPFREKQDRL